MEYVAPVPIDLPAATRSRRFRRLARTVWVFAQRLAPPMARRALGRPAGAQARAVREAFEHLGATYVKFGQLVGSSPGAFGEEAASEFRSCLDTGAPVPFEDVRAAIEADLERPLDDAFATFEPDPMAAASIAVVHRATLPDGSPVAVKVLRPGIEEVVSIDIDIMQPLFRFLALRGVPVAGPMYRFLSGFREQVAEELDLRNEARSMDHFRVLFAEERCDLIAVPEVDHSRTARHVLTMELLEGVPIDDRDGVARLGVDPGPVTRQLLDTALLTGLRYGIFHGDIHAGNLLLLPDGRVGMLDWGIVGRLDEDTRRLFRRFVEAVLGDEAAWADIAAFFAKVTGQGDGDERPDERPEVSPPERRRIEGLLTKPFGEVSLAGAFSANPVGAGIPQRSLAEKVRRIRRLARFRQRAIASGLLASGFARAEFMLFKQLLYFERFGKMYMADRALFGDREFLRAALDELPGGRPPGAE